MTPFFDFAWRREWRAPAAAAVVLAAAYCFSIPPGAAFEDAGLFAAVCYLGGIAHPPGYPLHTLLCAPLAQIADVSPLNPAQSSALLSVLCAAAAAALFYEIAFRFFGKRWLALALALALGLGRRYWSQAIIPEVYALNVLLLLATLAAVLRFCGGENRAGLTAAFFAGLGLANHWPLYLITAPAFVFILASRPGMLARFFRPASALCFAAGLLPYGYLFLRARIGAEPFVPVGGAETVGEVFAHISRSAYSGGEIALAFSERMQNAGQGLGFLAGEHFFFVFFCALPGLFLFFLRRPPLLAAGVLYGALASTVLLGFLLPERPGGALSAAVFSAYPLPAMPFLLLLAGGFLSALCERLRRPRAFAAAVFALLALLAAGSWRENDRGEDALAEEYARAVLFSMPPGARLFAATDFSFPILYLRRALGTRVDVVLAEGAPGEGDFVISDEWLSGDYDDFGLFQRRREKEKGVRAKTTPELMRFYARLPQWRKNARGDWNRLAVRVAIMNAARAFAIADFAGELTAEQEALFAVLRATPEGAFGELVARVTGRGKPLPANELRAAAKRLGKESLPPQWRAHLLQMRATERAAAGDFGESLPLLREAAALFPSSENTAVVDLLQLLAREKLWNEYKETRMKFARLENPSLPPLDEECKQSLHKPCR